MHIKGRTKSNALNTLAQGLSSVTTKCTLPRTKELRINDSHSELPNAQQFMATISSENRPSKMTSINLDNKSVNDSLTAELERYKEQVKVLKEGQNVDLKSKDNVLDSCEQSVEIDRLKQILSEHVKEKESLMQTKAQQLEPKLYDGNVIKNTSAIIIPDSEETPMLAEESRSKMLLKQQDSMMLENKNSMNSSDPSPSCRPTKVEVPKQTSKSTWLIQFEETNTILASLTWLSKEENTAYSPSLRARGVNQKSVEISDLNISLQEKELVITALKEELRKLKGKSVVPGRESMNKPKVIAPIVHKVELEPLSPKLKNNREAHVDYIRITKKNTDTLHDVVEQARTSNPLDNALAYACMYTKQIQELLVYVSDTCHSSLSKSEKLVAVTPMNKARKVTFAKTSTTSDNNTQIQVDVHQTQTTNKPLVPSTNEKCSSNASRSKPQSETKNNRIMQPLISKQKYQKVEAHTRNAKPSLTKEDSESKSVCLTCNKCYFDVRHDFCVVQHLFEVNDRARAKAIKSIKMKEWKPTGKMFKNVGYKWVPIGTTFTLVGTKCPLTRFTSTKIMPPRIPVKSTIITNKKPSSTSQWRPKETNHANISSAPKIVESRTANHLEPNNHMGSNVSISTCSSSFQCISYKSYLGNWIQATLHI
ncbi:hypothetical protein Tco_0161627 [Tanacetum coccineum]